jgi:hypothetical protein
MDNHAENARLLVSGRQLDEWGLTQLVSRVLELFSALGVERRVLQADIPPTRPICGRRTEAIRAVLREATGGEG